MIKNVSLDECHHFVIIDSAAAKASVMLKFSTNSSTALEQVFFAKHNFCLSSSKFYSYLAWNLVNTFLLFFSARWLLSRASLGFSKLGWVLPCPFPRGIMQSACSTLVLCSVLGIWVLRRGYTTFSRFIFAYSLLELNSLIQWLTKEGK